MNEPLWAGSIVLSDRRGRPPDRGKVANGRSLAIPYVDIELCWGVSDSTDVAHERTEPICSSITVILHFLKIDLGNKGSRASHVSIGIYSLSIILAKADELISKLSVLMLHRYGTTNSPEGNLLYDYKTITTRDRVASVRYRPPGPANDFLIKLTNTVSRHH